MAGFETEQPYSQVSTKNAEAEWRLGAHVGVTELVAEQKGGHFSSE